MLKSWTKVYDTELHSLIDLIWSKKESQSNVVLKLLYWWWVHIILKGVTISKDAMVAAVGVITKSIHQKELRGGTSAWFIRKYWIDEMRIAVIMTCHNRREKTIACLRLLFVLMHDADVFLTDDGSTDGTSEAVCKEFPRVHIVFGDGNLFWSRGMYTAWKEALKGEYEYYLWLNDDIELYSNVMDEVMECEVIGGDNCIISGLVETFDHSRILYGGSDSERCMVKASEKPQPITNMNGNVVLIPKSVVDRIGIIDPVLHHDLGDVDYGLTAIENGIKVLSTRVPVAAGYANDFCRVRKWGVNLSNRLRKLRSPLGSPPSINFYFRKKHYGMLNAIAYWCYLYFINFMPDKVIQLLFGDAYKD